MPEAERLIRIRMPEMIDRALSPARRLEILLKFEIKSDEDYQVLGWLFDEEE